MRPTTTKKQNIMKTKTLAGLIAAGLLMSGMTLLAQNGGGQGGKGQGKGYGGPPQSQEERAARQADCLKKNGGVCPNGGPQTNCPPDCDGQGQGKGQGKGGQHGKRDGTGPRNAAQP
jgi:hypothetical protein